MVNLPLLVKRQRALTDLWRSWYYPMMSIIRYLTDIGWHNDIYLLYCCRTTSEFLFREELEQLQERYLNLHVYASMLRSEGTVWMGLQGLFTKNIISHLVPDIASHRIHVCGPPAMMEPSLLA